MSRPRKADRPMINSVMQELISCQSSLNMPTPETVSPSDVVHAYEYLGVQAVT